MPPAARPTYCISSAASDVYKRKILTTEAIVAEVADKDDGGGGGGMPDMGGMGGMM